ncbi:MAG: nuclear transport factor 2 family protein [Deltaproteobacteria bacterium]|nr:nuclear transport factor 2 family protein [Deltaproteobacteria bacterium]
MATQRQVKKVKMIRKATPAKRPAMRRTSVAPTGKSPAAKLTATAEDYEGVRQVLSRYCFALDSSNLEELSSLFHRQADFSVSFENGQKHNGRETIHSWYQRFFEQRPREFHYMRHKLFEPCITVNKNTATSSTYFDSEAKDAQGQVQIITGRYDDALIKEGGQWLFKERTITIMYYYSPGTGKEGMR